MNSIAAMLVCAAAAAAAAEAARRSDYRKRFCKEEQVAWLGKHAAPTQKWLEASAA